MNRLPRTVEEARAHLKSIGLVRRAIYSYCQMAFRWMGMEWRNQRG